MNLCDHLRGGDTLGQGCRHPFACLGDLRFLKPWFGAVGLVGASLVHSSLVRPPAAVVRTCLSSWGRRASLGRSPPHLQAVLCRLAAVGAPALPAVAATRAGRTGQPVASVASSALALAPAPLAGYVSPWVRSGQSSKLASPGPDPAAAPYPGSPFRR